MYDRKAHRTALTVFTANMVACRLKYMTYGSDDFKTHTLFEKKNDRLWQLIDRYLSL